MEGPRRSLCALALAIVATGCVAEPLSPAAGLVSPPRVDPVVIAVLDSGSNPYLTAFEAADVAVPASAKVVQLSQQGSIRERFDQDEAVWDTMESRQLYHFAGTRLLSISFAEVGAPRGFDGLPHGTVTTYLAATTARDAIIVSVQIDPAICREQGCIAHRSIADGMEWIADQPWIDVVSVSLNLPANPPDPAAVDSEIVRYLDASGRAAREGKVIVNSAGNFVAGPATGYFAGPPWVIAVGGVEPHASGESLLAGKGVDVVGNFTVLAPKALSEALEWYSGTSVSTPIVAGTLADAMSRIREARPAQVVSSEQLRHALNATGIYFSPTSWDPTPSDRGPVGLAPVYGASLPVLLQPQMGWGYVDASLAPEIARRVLEDDLAPPSEKQQAVVFQAEWQRAREEYWSRYG